MVRVEGESPGGDRPNYTIDIIDIDDDSVYPRQQTSIRSTENESSSTDTTTPTNKEDDDDDDDDDDVIPMTPLGRPAQTMARSHKQQQQQQQQNKVKQKKKKNHSSFRTTTQRTNHIDEETTMAQDDDKDNQKADARHDPLLAVRRMRLGGFLGPSSPRRPQRPTSLSHPSNDTTTTITTTTTIVPRNNHTITTTTTTTTTDPGLAVRFANQAPQLVTMVDRLAQRREEWRKDRIAQVKQRYGTNNEDWIGIHDDLFAPSSSSSLTGENDPRAVTSAAHVFRQYQQTHAALVARIHAMPYQPLPIAPLSPPDKSSSLERFLAQHAHECRDRQHLLRLLHDANITLTSHLCQRLPTWSQVVDLYGPGPVVLGLETCAAYRDKLRQSNQPFANGVGGSPYYPPKVAIAGLWNSGTTALSLSVLLNLQGYKTEADISEPTVLWGKHTPLYLKPVNTWPRTKRKRGIEQVKEHILPVVIVRDPFRWMKTMVRMYVPAAAAAVFGAVCGKQRAFCWIWLLVHDETTHQASLFCCCCCCCL